MDIAIVTGASSGMGKEFVKMILQEYKTLDEIWVVARRIERLNLWPRLHKGQNFRILALDLQKPEDLDRFKQTLEEQQPRVKVFVHSAGFGIMGKVEEISREEQMEMVDVNCRAVVGLTCSVLPFLTGGARMIYLASAAAFLPQPGFVVYAASKAFVLSYTRGLRRELRDKNLRITAVCPGAVKTEFFNRATEKKALPAYKKMVMADMKKVVKKAWRDNSLGKEISVYGKMMQSFRLLTKILPHRVFLYFMKG